MVGLDGTKSPTESPTGHFRVHVLSQKLLTLPDAATNDCFWPQICLKLMPCWPTEPTAQPPFGRRSSRAAWRHASRRMPSIVSSAATIPSSITSATRSRPVRTTNGRASIHMAGRLANEVVLNTEERGFLEAQVWRHKAARSLSYPCRMILLCA
jgi:hypothetical protein